MAALMDLGPPGRVQLAGIVDQGHEETLIEPDFIGRSAPTSEDEVISVKVREVDGSDRVDVH